MGNIRDQLQTLTGADLLASQLSDAGGKVFVSANAKSTQVDLRDVVGFWSAIHAPTFGCPIPSSGQIVTADDTTATMLQPDANQTAYVQSIELTNTGSDDVTVMINNGGATSFIATVVGSSLTPVIQSGEGKMYPFYLVGGQSLTISTVGGSAGDIVYKVGYSLAIQG